MTALNRVRTDFPVQEEGFILRLDQGSAKGLKTEHITKMMDFSGGAYGGGKAGGAFDPIGFVMRPTVILRAVCWVNMLKINFQFLPHVVVMIL